jgi:hypothetical protein
MKELLDKIIAEGDKDEGAQVAIVLRAGFPAQITGRLFDVSDLTVGLYRVRQEVTDPQTHQPLGALDVYFYADDVMFTQIPVEQKIIRPPIIIPKIGR